MGEDTTKAIADLSARMSSSATGYAAVIVGVLNIRTVSAEPSHAALNAIYSLGYRLASVCQDPNCRCMEQLLLQLSPGAQVVRVSVEVDHGC